MIGGPIEAHLNAELEELLRLAGDLEALLVSASSEHGIQERLASLAADVASLVQRIDKVRRRLFGCDAPRMRTANGGGGGGVTINMSVEPLHELEAVVRSSELDFRQIAAATSALSHALESHAYRLEGDASGSHDSLQASTQSGALIADLSDGSMLASALAEESSRIGSHLRSVNEAFMATDAALSLALRDVSPVGPEEVSQQVPPLESATPEDADQRGATAAELDASVFAPQTVPTGDTFMVQVALHKADEAGEAAALAHEFDDEASARGRAQIVDAVELGARISVELDMPGVESEIVRSLRWTGRVELVQYLVRAPTTGSRIHGKVVVRVDGLPVGYLVFQVKTQHHAGSSEPKSLVGGLKRFVRAFVSYAAEDRDEVLRRVQALAAIQIEVFQDVLRLEPGQRWEEELYGEIDTADLFLLFWSKAAAKSEWVRREVARALLRQRDTQGLPEIRPVLLELPVERPWPELQHLHFGDRLLHLMSG